MSVRTLGKAAGIAVLAAIGIAASAPASAADLGHGYGSTKDGPYDDPRYSDVYKHPAPPRYAVPVPPAPVYPPQHYVPPPPVYYGGPAPRYGHAPPDCLPRHLIRQKLEARGWHDFHDAQVSGNVAHARARRPNGVLFDLTVDRCTGEVLQAEAIQDRHAHAPPAYAPPAYAPPPPADWRYRGGGGGYRY